MHHRDTFALPFQVQRIVLSMTELFDQLFLHEALFPFDDGKTIFEAAPRFLLIVHRETQTEECINRLMDDDVSILAEKEGRDECG
jgi:hypothetical protein